MFTSFLVQFLGMKRDSAVKEKCFIRLDLKVPLVRALVFFTSVIDCCPRAGSSSDGCGRRASSATAWSNGRTAAASPKVSRTTSSFVS